MKEVNETVVYRDQMLDRLGNPASLDQMTRSRVLLIAVSGFPASTDGRGQLPGVWPIFPTRRGDAFALLTENFINIAGIVLHVPSRMRYPEF